MYELYIPAYVLLSQILDKPVYGIIHHQLVYIVRDIGIKVPDRYKPMKYRPEREVFQKGIIVRMFSFCDQGFNGFHYHHSEVGTLRKALFYFTTNHSHSEHKLVIFF